MSEIELVFHDGAFWVAFHCASKRHFLLERLLQIGIGLWTGAGTPTADATAAILPEKIAEEDENTTLMFENSRIAVRRSAVRG